MAILTGRQVAIGFAKESARGTWVTPTYWIPATSINIDDHYNVIENSASFGVLNDVTGAVKSKQWSEGDVSGPIGDLSFGLLLKALFGTEQSAQVGGETLVYDHTFTLQTSAQHPSLSVTKADSVRTFGFPNSMVTGIEIDCVMDDYATFKLSLAGKAGASQSASASYTAENLFSRAGITLVRATTLAGLSSGTAISIKKFKVSLQPNVVHDDVLGSADPNDFLNTAFRIEGEFELFYNDDTFHDFTKNQTATYYRLKLINSGVTIGNSSNPTLTIDFANVVSKDWSRKDENDNIVSQTVKFVGKYNTTDALAMQAVLRNLRTTAY